MDDNGQVAVFGGGCFWCTEAVYAQLKGVVSVAPGYAGGHTENPTYADVCRAATGHAEVSKVEFDPGLISYRDLLDVFFATHDPTSLNRQGGDKGTRYRSIILYANEEQKAEAAAAIRELEETTYKPGKIVTEVVSLETFYDAEPEHFEFYAKNPGSMYCQIVIKPKVDKVRDKFATRLHQP